MALAIKEQIRKVRTDASGAAVRTLDPGELHGSTVKASTEGSGQGFPRAAKEAELKEIDFPQPSHVRLTGTTD